MGSQILFLLAACLLCANICQALNDNLIYDENKNLKFEAGQVYHGVKIKDRILFPHLGTYEVHKEFKVKELLNASHCLGFFSHKKVIVLDCPARNVSRNGCFAVFNKTEWNSYEEMYAANQLCPVDNVYETCKGIVTPDKWKVLFNCHFKNLHLSLGDYDVEPIPDDLYYQPPPIDYNSYSYNGGLSNGYPYRTTTTTTRRPPITKPKAHSGTSRGHHGHRNVRIIYIRSKARNRKTSKRRGNKLKIRLG